MCASADLSPPQTNLIADHFSTLSFFVFYSAMTLIRLQQREFYCVSIAVSGWVSKDGFPKYKRRTTENVSPAEYTYHQGLISEHL